jgi:hypothetical protein
MSSESLLAFSQVALFVNSAFMLVLNSIGLDSEPKVDKSDCRIVSSANQVIIKYRLN